MSKLVIGFNTFTFLVTSISLPKPSARVAVISTVPAANAVILPAGVTDTNVELLLAHVIDVYEDVDGVISVEYVNSSPTSISIGIFPAS